MRKNKTFVVGKYWICISWPLYQKSKYPNGDVWTLGFTLRLSVIPVPRESKVFYNA